MNDNVWVRRMPQTIIVTITVTIISILKHGKYAVLFSLSKATDGTCFEYAAVLTATMGYSFPSCSENPSCFINGFLYFFTIIFKYMTVYLSSQALCSVYFMGHSQHCMVALALSS